MVGNCSVFPTSLESIVTQTHLERCVLCYKLCYNVFTFLEDIVVSKIG